MSKNVLEQGTSQPTEVVGPDFMSGGGEMGALMRAHDWSSSSLGPPSNWSQSLRTVVRLMLNTGHPMYIFWGADSACLYNDAYRRSIGPEVSASFVIFCSTVSNALSPQAITEEVKSCKAISNDQQRLKCFDSLSSDKPNPPNAADKSASEVNWQIEESKSPTDGSLQIVAANLVGDTVLILRCRDHTTEAAFSTKYNLLGHVVW